MHGLRPNQGPTMHVIGARIGSDWNPVPINANQPWQAIPAAVVLGLAKSQQSVKTSFGKVVCELKAAELDFPSSVPKTGLYRQ
jgi:hypothetical protein